MSKHSVVLETLEKLQILTPILEGSEPSYALNKSFQQHVREKISSGTMDQVIHASQDVIRKAPSREDADVFAGDRWEQLLLYTVSGTPMIEIPSMLPHCPRLDLDGLLRSAGLISIDASEGEENRSITKSGFNFLLLDTYSQIWTILQSYISQAESISGSELSSVLGFFLKLGHHREQCISFDSLSASEKIYASHLYQLGILIPFRFHDDLWLKPTYLAVLLAGGAAGQMHRATDGFVIVETNFRVYAYTSSAIRQAILRLFVRCELLLPNLFVGSMNREIIMDALESGIRAEQILDYLRQHAHPRVAARRPVVPTVVSDQIRLWERETQRLLVQPAILYKNFERNDLYLRTRDYVDKIGASLLKDDSQRQLVAIPMHHDAIKAEIKKAKAQYGL